MGKRFSRGPDAPGGASRKRQKVVHEAPTHEDVHASRQLSQLLAFDQDVARARHGLQSFKVFLNAMLSSSENKNDDNSSDLDRAGILRDYLRFVQPRENGGPEGDEGSQQPYLPDIMQTWSYANQTNNENLMSAVPVVLALLLKVLSRSLEMVPYGLGICRTLLQKRQLELISRNLSTDKGKAFIISPTLRLLREAVSFDGGAVAKPLFRARASTFKSLARNMGIVHMGEEAEDEKKPSPRTTAVLFFLSAIKFLHPEAKKELVSQRDVVAALTRDLKQDPPYLVLELLGRLREGVLMDEKVPHEAKGNLLNVSTLVRISGLYQYRQTEDSKLPSIADAAHEFLVTACTNPSCGVLRQDQGFYPRDIDLNAVLPPAELEELGLEAIVWMNRYKKEIPVRNFTLSNFLPNLRPWASVKQSDLVTAIFKVAPELVAGFFLDNKSFTFDPKLSATWIGYAAFLFKTVTLPLPEHFSRGSGFPQLPPPLVVDNILPLPLSQKALVRCLANKSNMVSFFATRILVVAIEKLDAAAKMYQDPSHANEGLWVEAARRLVDEFCQRIPGIKDMINSYRSIPEADILHREAASRLLRLCYEVTPQVALLAKFDVSPFLEKSLGQLSEQKFDDPRDFAMSLKELENLLAIAGYSPGMRWFSASEALTLSPFTMLLKVCVDAPNGVSLDGIRRVLDFVAVEQQLVPAQKEHPGLLPLLEALQVLSQSSPELVSHIWAFLDNCLTRCGTAPIKYLEMMQDLVGELDSNKTEAVASPLAVTLLEQLPFAISAGDKEVLGALGKFLPKFFGLLVTGGESRPLLDAIYAKIAALFKSSKAKLAHKKIPGDLAFEQNTWPPKERRPTRIAKDTASSNAPSTSEEVMDDEELQNTLDTPDGLTADNSALVKWATKAVDELIDDGYVASLIKLLASEHASIRKEALVNILKAAAKIRESEHEEKEQIWLLLSELAETARAGHIESGPLPSTGVAFACHALAVLRDPLSSLYPKINQFLARGPVWNLDRLPLVDEVLLEEPAVGDSYYAQVNWLLGYLLDGLRTPKDLELFHKRRARGPVLERVLVLAGNPFMRLPLRTQVLRLLYRITGIEGGSTTMTTRFGVVNWLEAQEKACGEKEGDRQLARLYRGLKGRVWRTCDKERVGEWSKGGIKGLCEGDGDV
ncbi:ribosome 60S biogenesis N-terminal-domain-containing protein [Cercophora newfieldiana]|uniref:Ribosome 60S biogenesis N-terminal-domain-containing protein n=1 Tax=Cercophora newfieldiana TaxID=92897 RepID=A0AA40CN90_9PEZI|nr:ribosome 60S biogenesis N-terminal-domain-containing protein [Cercophora newfieldiana]